MSDGLHRRHALASFLEGETGNGRENTGAVLEVRPGYGYLNLRGDPNSDRFMQVAEAALGQPLPAATGSFTSGQHTIYRLGPDEWLLCTALGREKETAGQLEKNLAGQCYSLVDVTGGQVMMRLRGPRAREVLARGCTLDLHPRAFKTGRCAQSTLAKTSMLIALADDAPTFDIIVRRSFAEYAARWLRHSGASAHFRNSR